MKAAELRELSVTELKTKIDELSVELFKYRMQLATSQLEKFHKIKELKRDIARGNTILSEIKRTEA